MLVNNAVSPNAALFNGMRWLYVSGRKADSRAGSVLVSPHPVITINRDPARRVLVSEKRDANPFFHLMESLWMLAGRNDLAWLAHYNKRMIEYSDDGGKTQPGAYGHRWRTYFGYDQLAAITNELKRNPESRRCVLSMWGPGHVEELAMEEGEANVIVDCDLMSAISGSKDVPCNTHAYFDMLGGHLNMTVCCRSNDIWWGAHGANVVHFGFLLEYMAAMVGVPMGELRQFSNNYHLYTDVVPHHVIPDVSREIGQADVYNERRCLLPLLAEGEDIAAFDSDLRCLMETPDLYRQADTRFFRHVAGPMWEAWEKHKEKDYEAALAYVRHVDAEDWRIGCEQWLRRRAAKLEKSNG